MHHNAIMDPAINTPLPPAGAVDAHVHVFDPARFAWAAARTYTPGPATLQSLLDQHAAWGVGRAVLVQPSVYGTDNRCLLAALATGRPERLRGMAVVDLAQTTDTQLADLHTQGVRGLRLNLEVRQEHDPRQLQHQLAQAAACITQPGWCVQLHVAASLLGVVAAWIDRFHVPLVLDHFGGLQAADGDGPSPRLDGLLQLLATGRVYVKLSAFYRASTTAPDHADLAPLVRRLFDARPDRLLWGSDWPHTGGGQGRRSPDRVEPFRSVDIPAGLRALRRWAPDEAALHRVLVDNPAALYGFADNRPLKETP